MEEAVNRLSRHQCSVLESVFFESVLMPKKKKNVFSPLSLNAKLVGRLYECLAPAQGEVRGCISCAYLSVRAHTCV